MVRSTLFCNTAGEVKAFAVHLVLLKRYKVAELKRDKVDQYLCKQAINLNA